VAQLKSWRDATGLKKWGLGHLTAFGPAVLATLLVSSTALAACNGSGATVTTTSRMQSATSSPAVPTTSLPSQTTNAGSPTVSTSMFTMETCGGIITNPNLRPTVNHEDLLMPLSDIPPGFTSPGPKMTVASLGVFYASVPSTAPVVYVAFTSGSGGVQGSGGNVESIDETIGDVGSASVAAEMVTRIQQAAVHQQCLPCGQIMDLPGPIPNLKSIVGCGGSRAGAIADATVLAAKGPYVINVMWGNQSYASDSSPPSPTLPLPSLPKLASLVDAALARIPASSATATPG
jgi:hypothetical protein